jgi:mono/diheme cytochrome c family protein
MNESRRWIVPLLGVLLALTLVVVAAACGEETPAPAPTAETTTPAESPTAAESPITSPSAEPTAALDGAALVEERCTGCHGIDRIAAEDGDAAKWEGIVDQMIARGAQLDEQEKQAVVDYLAETYPDN